MRQTPQKKKSSLVAVFISCKGRDVKNFAACLSGKEGFTF